MQERVVTAYVPPVYWAVAYGLSALPTLEDLVRGSTQVGRAAIDAAVSTSPAWVRCRPR
jgi:hypothetical protein